MRFIAQKPITNSTVLRLAKGLFSFIAVNFSGTNIAAQTFTADDITRIYIAKIGDTGDRLIDLSGKQLRQLLNFWKGAYQSASTAGAAFEFSLVIPSARPNEANGRLLDTNYIVVIEVPQATLTAKVASGSATVLVVDTKEAQKYSLCMQAVDYVVAANQEYAEELQFDKVLGYMIDANTATLDRIRFVDSQGEKVNCRLTELNHLANLQNEIETTDITLTYDDRDPERNPLNHIGSASRLFLRATVAGTAKVVFIYPKYSTEHLSASRRIGASVARKELENRGTESGSLNVLAQTSGFSDAKQMASSLGL